MYEDKTLICKDCGAEFVFTAGEQEFYASKGFVNEPQRCKPCRDARKNAAKPEREMYTAQCAACGCEAKVPFKPREDRPVYCRFTKRDAQIGASLFVFACSFICQNLHRKCSGLL